MAQWFRGGFNNPGSGSGGAPQQDLGDTIRDLVQALGASTLNTNQQMGFLANNLGHMAQETNRNITQLGQFMQHGAQGHAPRSDDHGAGGYRTLKAKKDITSISAASAQTLMLELDQFEVDLGELGVHLQTEAAYRQLRAQCCGKARDVLDLELEMPYGKALKFALDDAVYKVAGQQVRDYAGGRLYMHCVGVLENSVRLTPSKRNELASALYADAKMIHDTVADAEDFLAKWRKARRLLYREGLVKPSTQDVLAPFVAQNCSGESLQFLHNLIEKDEMTELTTFMQTRISNSVYRYIKDCNPPVRSVDQCIAAIDRWIERETVPRPKSEHQGVIRVIEGVPVGVVDGVPVKFEFENPGSVSGSEPTDGTDPLQVSRLGQPGNAAGMASRGNQRSPAKNLPPVKIPGVPVCSTCNGQHPDVRTCPNADAAADSTFTKTPHMYCGWRVNGKHKCGGEGHFVRHHKHRWTIENPGKSLPPQESDGYKKGKGKGKGSYKGKRVIRSMHVLEDGSLVPEEDLDFIDYDGEELSTGAAETPESAQAQEPASVPASFPPQDAVLGQSSALVAEDPGKVRAQQWVASGMARSDASGQTGALRGPGDGLRIRKLGHTVPAFDVPSCCKHTPLSLADMLCPEKPSQPLNLFGALSETEELDPPSVAVFELVHTDFVGENDVSDVNTIPCFSQCTKLILVLFMTVFLLLLRCVTVPFQYETTVDFGRRNSYVHTCAPQAADVVVNETARYLDKLVWPFVLPLPKSVSDSEPTTVFFDTDKFDVPMDRYWSGRSRGDIHWDERAQELQQRPCRDNVPSRITLPRAYLYVCGQNDFSDEFLDSMEFPLIITCKDNFVPHVEDLARRHELRDVMLYNVGYHKERKRTVWTILEDAADHLNHGNDVVVHCHAGVHRAALSCCQFLMFFLGITFKDARRILEGVRTVRLDEIVAGERRRDGSYSEDHRIYLEQWEREALKDDNPYLLLPPLPTAPLSVKMTPKSASVSEPTSSSSGVAPKMTPKSASVSEPTNSSAGAAPKKLPKRSKRRQVVDEFIEKCGSRIEATCLGSDTVFPDNEPEEEWPFLRLEYQSEEVAHIEDLAALLQTCRAVLVSGEWMFLRALMEKVGYGNPPFDDFGPLESLLSKIPGFTVCFVAEAIAVKYLPVDDDTSAHLQPQLDGWVEKRPVVLIGVGGSSGVGKSTLCEQLTRQFNSPLGELHASSFFYRNKYCPLFPENVRSCLNEKECMVDPKSIDEDAFLRGLANVKDIFSTCRKVPDDLTYKGGNNVRASMKGKELPFTQPVLIFVAGPSVYTCQDVALTMDLCLWIDIDDQKECAERRFKRNKGRDPW